MQGVNIMRVEDNVTVIINSYEKTITGQKRKREDRGGGQKDVKRVKHVNTSIEVPKNFGAEIKMELPQSQQNPSPSQLSRTPETGPTAMIAGGFFQTKSKSKLKPKPKARPKKRVDVNPTSTHEIHIYQLQMKSMEHMEKKQYGKAYEVYLQILEELQKYRQTVDIHNMQTNAAQGGLRCIAMLSQVSEEDVDKFVKTYKPLNRRAKLPRFEDNTKFMDHIFLHFLHTSFLLPIYAFQEDNFKEEEKIKFAEKTEEIIKKCKEVINVVSTYRNCMLVSRGGLVEERIAKMFNDVFWTLGVILENMGKKKEALNFYKENKKLLQAPLPSKEGGDKGAYLVRMGDDRRDQISDLEARIKKLEVEQVESSNTSPFSLGQ